MGLGRRRGGYGRIPGGCPLGFSGPLGFLGLELAPAAQTLRQNRSSARVAAVSEADARVVRQGEAGAHALVPGAEAVPADAQILRLQPRTLVRPRCRSRGLVPLLGFLPRQGAATGRLGGGRADTGSRADRGRIPPPRDHRSNRVPQRPLAAAGVQGPPTSGPDGSAGMDEGQCSVSPRRSSPRRSSLRLPGRSWGGFSICGKAYDQESASAIERPREFGATAGRRNN